MSPEEIAAIMRHTLLTTLELAAPFLLLALVVGFLISLLQAVTNIQEVTLSFIPKILVVGVALVFLFPWIMKILTKFTHTLLITHWDKIIYAQ